MTVIRRRKPEAAPVSAPVVAVPMLTGDQFASRRGAADTLAVIFAKMDKQARGVVKQTQQEWDASYKAWLQAPR